MALPVENFRGNVTKAPCKRMQLLIGGMEVLSTELQSKFNGFHTQENLKDEHSEIGYHNI
jgi:hypothetical protein